MTNKIKVSNEFINLPAKLEARGFDMIFFVAHKLQDEELYELKEVSFTRKEIIETLGLNKTIGYKAIDKVISNMMNNKIDYSTEDNSFISFLFAEYVRDSEEMTIRVTERMAKLFLHLSEQYTIADLYIISRLKSIFSKRIYMLILQYKNLKNNRTIEVNELKKLLQVEGKYKTKQHLCYYILEVAKKEINTALPKINLSYEITKDSKKNQYVTFYFNTDFMLTEQPQHEQKASVFDNIIPAEQVQYNKNKRVLKIQPPTIEEIYLHMQTSGARINAEVFYYYYQDRDWLDENGKPLSWRSKVEKWGVKVLENPQEYKRNAELYNQWEKKYKNETKYKDMAEKMKSYNITDMDFIKELVDKKLEHTFNFKIGRLYEINEFRAEKGRQANSTEYMFIDKWERKYGYYKQ